MIEQCQPGAAPERRAFRPRFDVDGYGVTFGHLRFGSFTERRSSDLGVFPDFTCTRAFLRTASISGLVRTRVQFCRAAYQPARCDVPDHDSWALGEDAGIYLNATQAPWSMKYQTQ